MGNSKGTPKKGKKDLSRPKTAGRSAPQSPKKPFRLEVGKTYQNKGGDLRVKIVRKRHDFTYPMNGEVLAGSAWLNDWTEDGWYFEDGPGDENDLVREVPGAKRPRAAARGKKPSLGTDNEIREVAHA